MRRYLSVLVYAARGDLADQKGRTWPDLTDDEAAAWIQKLYGLDYTPDAGLTRALLMGKRGDPLDLAGRPLAYAHRRRTCRVSGEDALAYRASDALYGFEPKPYT